MSDSHHIPASIYGYLFNAKRFSFPYRETLANFCAFADEVVIATIEDEDNTVALLQELTDKLPNLRVLPTDIKIDGNNRFDGQLKTAAMRATTHKIKIIADLDETFVLSQKPLWQQLYKRLLDTPEIDGFLVPSLDLWGSPKRIRSDQDIGQKFRVHKDTVYERGVPNFAERGSGLIDTSRSDTTEAINRNGDLCKFISLVSMINLYPAFARTLETFPYTVHHGYEKLEGKAAINRDFWKQHWEERSGRNENVVTELRDLEKVQTVEHGLVIE